MKIIKLMPEYGGCWPLWDADGNLNPAELPIPKDLVLRLNNWADTFEKTLNNDYPPDSGFANIAAETSFHNEGTELLQSLQKTLGPEYQIVGRF